MDIIPFLRSQDDLQTGIKQRMRDTDGERWPSPEIYNAVNDSILIWGRRVIVPFYYALSSGFEIGTFNYSLPSYIREPLDVQAIRFLDQDINGLLIDTSSATAQVWQDVPGWGLELGAGGGLSLRLDVSPWAEAARIIWWAQNGPIPTTTPALNAGINSTDTTLTIASVPVIGNAGYIKVDAEWIAYSGIAVGATTTTLQNLSRGMNDTTAASHLISASVYWGIAAHRQDLFDQLFNQVCFKLHSLFLTNASPQETEHHVFQARFYKQLADEFWRGYVGPRNGKMVLSRQGIGRLP